MVVSNAAAMRARPPATLAATSSFSGPARRNSTPLSVPSMISLSRVSGTGSSRTSISPMSTSRSTNRRSRNLSRSMTLLRQPVKPARCANPTSRYAGANTLRDFPSDRTLRVSQVEIGLKAEPEFRGDAEVFGQSQGGIGSDRPLAVHDRADAAGRDGDVAGEPVDA